MRLRHLWLALVFLAAATSPARGQQSFELGALFGYYRPLGQFDNHNTVAAGLPERPQNLSGVAVGGEAEWWFGLRWGIGLEGATASSRTPDAVTPGGVFPGAAARVTSVAARLIYGVSEPRARMRLWLGAGPAVIHHGGSAYSRYGAPTDPGLSLAVGGAVRLSRHIQATAGVGATLYDLQVSGSGELIQSAVAKDVLLHMGLAWIAR